MACWVTAALAAVTSLAMYLQQESPSKEPVAVYRAAQTLRSLDSHTSTTQGRIPPTSFRDAESRTALSADHSRIAYARTNGPFYGDLHLDGELERAVRLISRRGEVVLLHGDTSRFRMLVNLVANLNELSIFHILLLGFSPSICHIFRYASSHVARINGAMLSSS